MPVEKGPPQPTSKGPVIEISDDESAPNSQSAEPSPAAPPEVKLSPEQKAVLRHVMEVRERCAEGESICRRILSD